MLKSVTVRFDPVEDRLLIGLHAGEGAQAGVTWLHLTRRVCAAWRRDLQAVLEQSAEAPERLSAPARSAVQAAHHEALASLPARGVDPAKPDPAAGPPLLVTGVACGRRRDDRRWVLRFELRDAAPVQLVLTDPTLHAMVDTMSQQLRLAGWDLPALPVEAAARATAEPPAGLH